MTDGDRHGDAPGELDRMGARSLPVLALGDRHVMGVDLGAVAELLGLDHDDRPGLDPMELVARLRVVLSTAMRLTQQIPTERLADTIPNRDRSYQSLANHVVQIPAGSWRWRPGHHSTPNG